MTSNTTKMLGAWGGIAVLMLSLCGAFVPGASLLSTAAVVMVLLAFLRAAAELRRPGVRKATLISVALMAGAVAVLFASAWSLVIGLLTGGMDAVSGVNFGGGLIGGFLLCWLLLVASAWYAYVASAELTQATGVELFKLSGLLYFIGVITLVIGIGAVIILVAAVLQVIAFFSLPDDAAAGGGAA